MTVLNIKAIRGWNQRTLLTKLWQQQTHRHEAWPSLLYLPLCCPFAPASYLRKKLNLILFNEIYDRFLSWWSFSSRFFYWISLKLFHFKNDTNTLISFFNLLSSRFEVWICFLPPMRWFISMAHIKFVFLFLLRYVFFAFSDVINHKWAAATAVKHIINDK